MPAEALPDDLLRLGAELHAQRPRPRLAFVTELDARAAAGFPRRRPRVRLPRLQVLVPGTAAAALAVAVIVAVVLSGGSGPGISTSSSGGGGGSAGASSAGAATRAAPAEVPPTGTGTASAAGGRRYVQHEASIALTTRPGHVADVADRIVAVADQLGGYVASSSVTATDGAGGGGDFDLEVPAARLQDALARLSRIAHVTSRTEGSVDITAQHSAARDRLQTARAERRSLLRRLAAATTDTEVSALKGRLRDVGRRIAADQRALRAVDRQAAYADISVTLQAAAGAGGAQHHRFTPGGAVRDALRVLEVAAGVLLIALAVALPVALLVAAGLALRRLGTRRGRERVLDAV